MKTCTSKYCIEVNPQPLCNFHKNNSRKDGHSNKCKSCVKTYEKINAEKIRERRIKFYNKNINKIRELNKKLWIEKNDNLRNSALKSKFNITLEEYNNRLSQQNNCCAICKSLAKDNKRNLAVDHCHKSNKIRGLLCGKCNKALGLLKDDVKIFKQAIDYLENNK